MLTAVLVTSAATLMESVPFILAGMALQGLPFRWNARIVPYLGCGCGAGPSARSLPAAAATWIVFGPVVAALRVCAAIAIDCIRARGTKCAHETSGILTQLTFITPLALIGGGVSLFGAALLSTHTTPAVAFAGGAAAGFALAPCGLGAIGLAAAMRGTMPASAAGFLCVAGLFDLRTWLRDKHAHRQHDALAYAIAAIACASIAARGGGALVHPKIALALWPCAIACAVLAYRHRSEACAKLRIAPIVMLIGAVLAAPPPAYHATETTLADAFPGEHVDFTGELTRTGTAATLVRYAITCCRADAAPIVLRLERAPSTTMQGWMHARGVLVSAEGGLRLRLVSIQAVTRPADPFVYR